MNETIETYTVVITRTSFYLVDETSEEAAIDKALSGEIEEAPGGETTDAQAFLSEHD